MYQPAAFRQDDPAAIAALLACHPLATLVHACAEGEWAADLIPMQWRPDATGLTGRLVGHVARANGLWRHGDGQTVLAVFQGPQAYITPSWYPTKAATAQVVPTWNYAVVQAHGRLRSIDDPAWLLPLVESLTHQHEASQAHAWKVSDAPTDYIGKMLRAIVGIEIQVTRLDAKWKVSQNRALPDRLGVVAGLTTQGSDEALAMAALARPADPA
jgi:transcriptional regulator